MITIQMVSAACRANMRKNIVEQGFLYILKQLQVIILSANVPNR